MVPKPLNFCTLYPQLVMSKMQNLLCPHHFGTTLVAYQKNMIYTGTDLIFERMAVFLEVPESLV